MQWYLVLNYVPLYIIAGLEIDVLYAIHNLVKEKAGRLHMWKGSKKTRDKHATTQYIKVSR